MHAAMGRVVAAAVAVLLAPRVALTVVALPEANAAENGTAAEWLLREVASCLVVGAAVSPPGTFVVALAHCGWAEGVAAQLCTRARPGLRGSDRAGRAVCCEVRAAVLVPQTLGVALTVIVRIEWPTAISRTGCLPRAGRSSSFNSGAGGTGCSVVAAAAAMIQACFVALAALRRIESSTAIALARAAARLMRANRTVVRTAVVMLRARRIALAVLTVHIELLAAIALARATTRKMWADSAVVWTAIIVPRARGIALAVLTFHIKLPTAIGPARSCVGALSSLCATRLCEVVAATVMESTIRVALTGPFGIEVAAAAASRTAFAVRWPRVRGLLLRVRWLRRS
mmetsp:Transcript_57177/g.118702  ORF Transcript_57177/g.118702 Transcript_57177/m.118702 type:complete len:343 (-) Transcript_57177:238-1266(-)